MWALTPNSIAMQYRCPFALSFVFLLLFVFLCTFLASARAARRAANDAHSRFGRSLAARRRFNSNIMVKIKGAGKFIFYQKIYGCSSAIVLKRNRLSTWFVAMESLSAESEGIVAVAGDKFIHSACRIERSICLVQRQRKRILAASRPVEQRGKVSAVRESFPGIAQSSILPLWELYLVKGYKFLEESRSPRLHITNHIPNKREHLR